MEVRVNTFVSAREIKNSLKGIEHSGALSQLQGTLLLKMATATATNSLEEELDELLGILSGNSDALLSWFHNPCGFLLKPDFKRSEQTKEFIIAKRSSTIRSMLSSGYKRRYFVLSILEKKLRYYETADSKTEKGVIDLNTIEAIDYSHVCDAGIFSFDLISKDKHFTLTAENKDDCHRWCLAIKRCLKTDQMYKKKAQGTTGESALQLEKARKKLLDEEAARQTARELEEEKKKNDIKEAVRKQIEKDEEDTAKKKANDIQDALKMEELFWADVSIEESAAAKAQLNAAKALIAADEKKKEALKATIIFECIYEHGAHVRETPHVNACNIGEFDMGEISHGTGAVDIDGENGVMFIELAPSSRHPTGGWVRVLSADGRFVVKETTPVPRVLVYKCIYPPGANVRNKPGIGSSIHAVGEIDEGDVAAVTGKVEIEVVNESGIGVFIELAVSNKYPQGGWVPLMSTSEHSVMVPYTWSMN